MPTLKRKVVAYITHGQRLLVFLHPFHPDAGIQVPAGTLEEGEPPEVGVLREAFEETGLADLALVSCLGEQTVDLRPYGADEIHHRYYYHLRCAGEPPQAWRHYEMHPSEGGTEPIAFDFYWVRLPDEVPDLSGGKGHCLPQLLAVLSLA